MTAAIQEVFSALASLAPFSSSLRSSHIPPTAITNNHYRTRFASLAPLISASFTGNL